MVLKIITTFNGLASAFRFTLLNEGIPSDDWPPSAAKKSRGTDPRRVKARPARSRPAPYILNQSCDETSQDTTVLSLCIRVLDSYFSKVYSVHDSRSLMNDATISEPSFSE